ncbi:MAG: ribonuclease J [Candidatus Harrisonbacteria bacterium CG10_big_fil_rev_8_21_14_0_10_38_8]|uniref:Ribonuclease J n=1 Tax=Candidatus Harrisonbacteria bacterium CG10_big_fil_rev_8_21_14_0_10_38_8 TaxID=1974582 RepID=A0A2M6WK32_9BACT|nr:MAG: ribonuclease J [Candidatus Harrisonbacteria bacterium CG10_big_fil_rev_8_21_14_0_10_38_8]
MAQEPRRVKINNNSRKEKTNSFSFSPEVMKKPLPKRQNDKSSDGVVVRPSSNSSNFQRASKRAVRELTPFKLKNILDNKKFARIETSMTGEESNGVLKRNTLYWVPLGGLEEVGRNCMFFEYNDEIVIIDAGIQFPEEETPGVDWIIPNVAYLEKKKKNIKALIITHAHYDHFGAVPYILERIGNPPIYGTKLVKAILDKKLSEMPNSPKMKFHEIKNHDRLKMSPNFSMEVFGVSHTVPDTTGILLNTPAGKMVHFADFRLDYDTKGNSINLEEFEWLGEQGVHSLFIDSTNADFTGHATSEELVVENIATLFKEAKGRIILSTFASMIERLGEIIMIAERLNKKVIINGRSMIENIDIAKSLGYIKHKLDTVVPIQDIGKYKDSQLVILSTGAQGQENAGLMRILNGEHRYVTIKPGDTVIFSSSVIPGNERSVQNLKDNFSRQGAIVHTNSDLDIHTSGHSPGGDLALVAQLTKPKFVIPIHAYYYKRAANLQNMEKVGFPKEKVILADNGQVVKITEHDVEITKKTVDSFYVLVDGIGVGDVEAIVLRDRRHLAEEGMVVVIATINRKTGQLLKNPDIISRGFIYLKNNTELLNETRRKIKTLFSKNTLSQDAEVDYIKTLIREQVGLFLFKKTERRPMVLPVLIEI